MVFITLAYFFLYSYMLQIVSLIGGRIDHGHHATQAAVALLETVMFDSAVQVAKEMTDTDDTLLVVTADHSHAFMIAGYPSRGNDILGEEILVHRLKPLLTISLENDISDLILRNAIIKQGQLMRRSGKMICHTQP